MLLDLFPVRDENQNYEWSLVPGPVANNGKPGDRLTVKSRKLEVRGATPYLPLKCLVSKEDWLDDYRKACTK